MGFLGILGGHWVFKVFIGVFLRFIKYLWSNVAVLEINLVVLGVTGCFRVSLKCFLQDIFLGSNLGVLNFWTFLRVTGCFREIIGGKV